MKNFIFNDKGFTLMELLVVVVIVAVLAGVAVPKYKKATLKARFSTVIPMAKAIADAQEVYYQGRQMYALDTDELDVTPIVTENVSITLSPTDGYDYVMAQHSQVPGVRYIIYQKYSENYPGETHCEAQEGNDDAQWLCGVLSNNNDNIGQTVTDGYLTYIMEGTGAGLPVGAGNDDGGISCSAAEAMGLACNITTNEEGEQVKRVCTGEGENRFCRTQTYNEDGSYTSVTCRADSNDVCTDNWNSATYDENGNKTSQRGCVTIASDGTCSVYSSVYINGIAYDYTYDANGNMTSQRYCQTVASDGTCSEYNGVYYYTYDGNGNQTSARMCSTIASDGTCSEYFPWGGHYDYTYDANGNMTSHRACEMVASDGTCSAYDSWDSFDFTYDANGNMTSQRRCSTVESDGTCSAYGLTFYFVNQVDANGNVTSERTCDTVESDGTCSTYLAGSDSTYDANGNKTSTRYCSTVESDGTCSEYDQTIVYIYDDNGKLMGQQSCYSWDDDINTNTGECTAYSTTNLQAN